MIWGYTRDGLRYTTVGWGNTTDDMGLHKRRPALHNSRDGATQQMIWGYTRDGLRYTTVGMGRHNR